MVPWSPRSSFPVGDTPRRARLLEDNPRSRTWPSRSSLPSRPVDLVHHSYEPLEDGARKRRLCLAALAGSTLLSALGGAFCLAWRTVETSSKLEDDLEHQAARVGKGASSSVDSDWPPPDADSPSDHAGFDCTDLRDGRSVLATGYASPESNKARWRWCCRHRGVGCEALPGCEANASGCDLGGHGKEGRKGQRGSREQSTADEKEGGRGTGTSAPTTAPSPAPTLRGADFVAARVPVAPPRNDSLFCFTLFIPGSDEEDLLSRQLMEGIGLFECEAYAVYSNISKTFGKGQARTVDARIVDVNLACEYGKVHMDNGITFTTAFNTPIFIVLWKKVFSDATFREHNWTVKVDPDTVFFPDRLRSMVRSSDHADAATGAGMFLNNCKLGLHGPIEVLSSSALETWALHHDTCQDPPEEDVYLQQCLVMLGAKQMEQYDLLAESSCHRDDWWQNPYWEDCNTGEASFHPFKNMTVWKSCHTRARKSGHDMTKIIAPGDALLRRRGEQAESELPPAAAFAVPGTVPAGVAPFMGTLPVPTPEPTPPPTPKVWGGETQGGMNNAGQPGVNNAGQPWDAAPTPSWQNNAA